MSRPARLVATLTAPPPAAESAGAPSGGLRLTGLPGRQALLQRGDTEVRHRPVAGTPIAPGEVEHRFPAPWPQRYGQVAVAPDGSLAVFTGVHAVRAVDAAGAVRWELAHSCWAWACRAAHAGFEEYADDRGHRYADSGSAGFSADGRLLWAHVRGPLGEDGAAPDPAEEWLLLDPADGRVLGGGGVLSSPPFA
ncbi:hypothetical protein [Kitasatospora sp. LaBMicrA B282]|uniref:hypothetical protein n=1 Tax=Kitasatospora sp. LaBMicrA B282 TaxID=3420949 RepID=UPI003D09B607